MAFEVASSHTIRCSPQLSADNRVYVLHFHQRTTQKQIEQTTHVGVVSGVQSSLQAALEMGSFVASLAFPSPAHFFWLICGSLASVVCSAGLTLLYAVKEATKHKQAVLQLESERDQREALLDQQGEEGQEV